MAADSRRWVMMGAAGVLALASLVAAVVVSINLLWSGFAKLGDQNQSYQPPEGATLPVGSAAPNFTATNLDGTTVQLSNYRGKIVLLKIWSVASGDCTVTMPKDEEIYQQLSDDVVLITIAVQSSEESVRSYAKQFKTQYPIVLDPNDDLMTLYNVKMTPTIYLIDPQGTIRSIFPVLASVEDINHYIEACGAACRTAES